MNLRTWRARLRLRDRIALETDTAHWADIRRMTETVAPIRNHRPGCACTGCQASRVARIRAHDKGTDAMSEAPPQDEPPLQDEPQAGDQCPLCDALDDES